ncbi:hypothetical protein SAMN04488096_105253 [Mesonia phycicola]|uniref:DUF748 domain-containing protein n=1 Tax=Mesonia phycicola TaxID=579105 RepID=A0A1M6ETU0_9FLAO|nr:hypothetical protein [Mesonia phycicola]SHI88809.1 hypothetical protein SAMN04488096_105253 [Mesonia phycicola]
MKKYSIVVGVVLASLVVLFFIAQIIVKNKIENALEGKVAYVDLRLNLLSGSVKIIKPSYKDGGNVITGEVLSASGFGYYSFFVKDIISLNQIDLQDFKIDIEKSKADKSGSGSKMSFNKDVLVGEVLINGTFSFQQDSLRSLNVNHFGIELGDVEFNKNTLTSTIPFRYKDVNIDISKVDYTLNQLQKITLDNLWVTQDSIAFSHLKYLPRLSKKDYIKVIPYEKDLIDLKVETLVLRDYKLNLDNLQNQLSVNYVDVNQVDLSIYRDKTIKDDVRKKDLYSKMLREMDFKINVDSLKVKNMYLEYQELINKNRGPGKIFFNPLEVDIYRLTNVDLEREQFPETEVYFRSKFMGKSNFKANWRFKINNLEDLFVISGSVFNISQNSINSFFEPALGVKTQGNVSELYFNFKGNSTQANGELQIDYQDFKLEVLKKESAQENKFLSTLANIFVKKKPKNDGETTVKPKEVKRDVTKSFWNYFWKCIQSGLKEVFIVL